jgi:elongation factor G
MGHGNATVRNVALVGPNGSGKTTLLESLLFVTGVISRKGRVMDGNTVGDHAPEARERQMSTEVTAATTTYDGVTLTLLDCPGSIEFAEECRNALMGVDAALVVVEPVRERLIAAAPLFKFLDSLDLPHLVFINKMDRSDAAFRDLLEGVRDISDRPVVPRQYAIGRADSLVGYIDLVTEEAYGYKDGGPSDKIALPEEYREREQAARTEMLETLADFDDDLMEMLLEDREPPAEEVLRHLRNSLKADQVVPVFLGVAEQDKGVRRLLEALVRDLPGPEVRAERLGIDQDGPALAQVLKTYHVPHSGKLSLVRVWRGEIKDGMQLGGNRVGGVFRMLGSQHNNVGSASAGEIVGLGRLEDARTGQTLAEGTPDVELPRAEPLPPMFAFALKAKNRDDEVKLSGAFARLADEDPSLRYEQDPEMRQALLFEPAPQLAIVAID